MERSSGLPLRPLVWAVAASAVVGCAGSWSDPRPGPGTPAPAQPTGTAARPVSPDTPSPAVSGTDLTPDKSDSLRAAFLLDSIARADSARADSARRTGATPGRR
jgi:hypothetical protein